MGLIAIADVDFENLSASCKHKIANLSKTNANEDFYLKIPLGTSPNVIEDEIDKLISGRGNLSFLHNIAEIQNLAHQGIRPQTLNSRNTFGTTLQDEIDKFNNVPGYKAAYLASQDTSIYEKNIPSPTEGFIKITDETLFEDIPQPQRKVLFEDDNPLYSALFYLEYDGWPGGMLSPEISDANVVVSRITKTQLPILRKMEYADLKKEKKLNRLRVMDINCYNRKCGYTEDQANADDKGR